MPYIQIAGKLLEVSAEDLSFCLGLRLHTAKKSKPGHTEKWYVEHVERVNGRRVRIGLHRIIAGELNPSVLVDHIDGNTLNCRRDNLRCVSPKQNSANTRPKSGSKIPYKGVTLEKTGKYRARIVVEGRRKSLGQFNTPEEAAEAYKNAAKEFHGEFAWAEA